MKNQIYKSILSMVYYDSAPVSGSKREPKISSRFFIFFWSMNVRNITKNKVCPERTSGERRLIMNKNLYGLQKEAKRAANILRIKCPDIVYDAATERTKCIQISVEGDFCIILNPEEDFDFQLAIVLISIRMIWAVKKFSAPSIEDALCFEAGYRVYFLKEDVRELLSDISEEGDFDCAYLHEFSDKINSFGNGYEERCAWLEVVRNGLLV